MTPLPPDIIARWSPMWAKGCHPERPWWQAVYSQVMTGPLVRWRRADGRETGYYKVPVTWGEHDDSAMFFLDTPRAELARIDAAHPLPAPPPMPGQVWVRGPDEWLVLATDRKRNGLIAQSGDFDKDVRWVHDDIWPPDGAILVAGPTPWGFSCPWSPA